MYERILVPVDFSPKSVVALKAAISLAKKTNSSIDLMNVVEVPLAVRAIGEEYETTAPKGQELLGFLISSSKKRLNETIQKVDAQGVDIKIKTKVDAQPEKLAEIITENPYDLIVIGGITKPFDEFLQKTHPERIVELAKCPVLSVNGDLENYTPRNIVVPTNLRDDYTAVIEHLKWFQGVHKATIHFVYINTPAQFKTTSQIDLDLDRFKEKHDLGDKTTYSIYCDTGVRGGVINFTEKVNADTIAVFSKHKDNFFKIIRGDITEYLVNHSSVPVLTLNMKTMVKP